MSELATRQERIVNPSIPVIEEGKLYQLRYRLPDQQKDRYARLVYMGVGMSGPMWSGRPLIGTLTLKWEWVKSAELAVEGLGAAWDRSKP